ncbi:proton-conducting transporter membrane subunit [Microbacterium sp. Kw_RZR3]|uniref:proton-conducting transporter transmembrane domain-containing protein n=1 Tax=Microbacterium sp. Kw_RZR3 TaxID=3032903 RepID=UPI0023DCA62A|nr:proton-conducting transporter membrane subunit [Microbacterium sp. Kw_RZR3]MDF2047088.1 proton-conducting transporter membrane subunit [Microbacterium sp. Kw_RZR3]
MSPIAPLLTAALLAAVVAALLPDAARHRTPGSLAVWPGVAAAALATLGLAGALADRSDVAGAALALLIVALTVVVQVYASRHLRGDPRSRSFFALSSLAALGSTTAIAADDVVLLAVGWTLATLSTVALIASGGSGPQTRVAVRQSAAALLLGDAALWTAVVVATASTGSISLAALGSLDGVAAAAVSALVAIAAIARAGSFPLHGWLPATAATTTPVSALLHAGFVNAGALLLLRFSPVPSTVGPWIAGIAGAITLLIATLAMLTRADVKGRLVHSTAAQMGFLLLACALGAYGLAFVHVIGHALFKASLFLGAGSAVEHALRARALPRSTTPRTGRVVGALLVVGTAAIALIGSDAFAHPTAVLLLFAVTTAAVAGARIGASSARVPTRAALLLTLSIAVVGYVAVVFPGAEALVPVSGTTALPWGVAVAVFVIAVASLLLIRSTGPVSDRIFALALAWGRPPLPAPTPSWAPASAGDPLEYRRV